MKNSSLAFTTPNTEQDVNQKQTALDLAEKRHARAIARKPKSFLSIKDLSVDDAASIVQSGLIIKAKPDAFAHCMDGLSVALLFQKTSTRTRCSFEIGAVEMGAHATYIDWRNSNFALADLQDEARVLSRYYDMVIARVNQHQTLQTMAAHSESPVINGMCDTMHPCQIMADFMTLSEYFGADLEGLHITYIGDGNNVCRSLIHGAEKFGCQLTLCSPDGYTLPADELVAHSAFLQSTAIPQDAVRHADIIYTDTWVSIGSETETAQRLKAFDGYQINADLMGLAPKHTLFMHCLPAHIGQEVTADVLRSPRSVVFDQAENRKHAQKAIMKMFAQKKGDWA